MAGPLLGRPVQQTSVAMRSIVPRAGPTAPARSVAAPARPVFRAGLCAPQGLGRPRRAVAARAMFDSLSQGLEKVWDTVRKDGKLTAENVKTPMRDIRRALLEADVSLPVVRGFIKRVEEKALGIKVIKGVNPEQQLVKVVYDEILELIGSEKADLNKPNKGQPQVILLAGLQGVGKTTACGKLAKFLAKEGKRVLMVSTDVYRPAAIDQLGMLAEQVGVQFLRLPSTGSPPAMAKEALEKAKKEKFDVLLVDTAGRLQVDASMMTELKEIQAATKPTDTLLVVDAMTGQEAAQLTKSFNDAVGLTGAILTKMDGDSRGGAALSVKAVSGQPIKFVGSGEKMDALEPFYPDRMASRILGMGDILSLVEKAQEAVSEEDAMSMMRKMMSNKFDYNDFLKQYKSVSGMGGLSSMVKMLPGMNKITDKQLTDVEKKYFMFESCVNSMTPAERSQPELLAKSASRRRRVARGAARKLKDVEGLVATFTGMRVQMQTMAKMMAAQGGMGGSPMDDKAMMDALASGMNGSGVPSGLVRRRKVTGTVKKPIKAKTKKGFGAKV